MVAIAVSCEELKADWLSQGGDNLRDSGLWICQALPKQVLQAVCEYICGAIRLAPLDSFHLIVSLWVSLNRCFTTEISCECPNCCRK